VEVTHTHLYVKRGESEERHVDIIASPVRDSQGKIVEVVELMRDVTDAKRLEKQLKEAHRNLLALNTISSTVSESLELDTILNSALDKVLDLMKGDTGGILLLDEESQTLSYAVHRGLSEEFVRGIAGLRLGEGIAGKVAQLGEPIYVDNISKDSRLTRPVVVKEGLRAFASLPLQSKSKVLGVMNIASHSIRRFTPEDIQLLNSIANQIAVAIENAQLYNEVQRKEEIRGELLRLVISTQEEERKRIARGLHDETSQALTSLAVHLESVMASLSPDAEAVKTRLREIQSLAVQILDEIRKVIYELRPTLLDDLGLVAALEWYAENYLETASITVHLETEGSERRLPIRTETELFRIIQEAFTNIVRHANAESVSVSLQFGENSVAMYIEDDGKGFDIEEVMRSRHDERGLGLLGMKERAELLGGLLSIQSQPGLGTKIDVEVPNGKEATDG